MKIREAGDSALLLELDEVINVSVNAQAIAIAHTTQNAICSPTVETGSSCCSARRQRNRRSR